MKIKMAGGCINIRVLNWMTVTERVSLFIVVVATSRGSSRPIAKTRKQLFYNGDKDQEREAKSGCLTQMFSGESISLSLSATTTTTAAAAAAEYNWQSPACEYLII